MRRSLRRSLQGFHPLRAFFPVRTEDGGIKDLEIYSPWMAEQPSRYARAGCVWLTLLETKSKHIRLGAMLEVNPGEGFTRCILESNAPILSLHRERPLVGQLADECEILLAERRAAWLGDEDRFQERLAATPAEMLYPACLEALLEKFKRLPRLGDQPAADDLYQFIGGEIHAMQAAGLWPAELLPLEQML